MRSRARKIFPKSARKKLLRKTPDTIDMRSFKHTACGFFPAFVKARGQTLLEICMTLGIFAVLGALSAPRVSALSGQMRLSRSVSQIEDLLVSLPALSRQFDRTLTVRMIQNRLSITTRESPATKVRTLIMSQELGIRINTTDQKLLAHPSGVLSPCRITISSGNRSCALTVALRGRITSSCSPDQRSDR